MAEALIEENLKKHVLDSIQLDMTKLQKYEVLKAELVSVDLVSGPLLMRDFMYAYEEAVQISTKVRKMLEDADADLKHEEAKAVLERAPKYFESNPDVMGKLKDSKSLRDAYVPMDEGVRLAREKVSALKAMVKVLENKAETFRMAHDDAKKIYAQLGEGPFAKTGFNGIASGGKIGDKYER